MKTTGNTTTLEERINVLEAELAELKQTVKASQQSQNWLDRMLGSSASNPAFDEAERLGREIRQVDRPADAD